MWARVGPIGEDRRVAALMPLVLSTGLVLVAACGSEQPEPGAGEKGSEEGFSLIEAGMSMDQVLAAWGTPNVKVREGNTERWSYWIRDEERRVVAKTYVLFDADHKVSEVILPPQEIHDGGRAPVQTTRLPAMEVEV